MKLASDWLFVCDVIWSCPTIGCLCVTSCEAALWLVVCVSRAVCHHVTVVLQIPRPPERTIDGLPVSPRRQCPGKTINMPPYTKVASSKLLFTIILLLFYWLIDCGLLIITYITYIRLNLPSNKRYFKQIFFRKTRFVIHPRIVTKSSIFVPSEIANSLVAIDNVFSKY